LLLASLWLELIPVPKPYPLVNEQSLGKSWILREIAKNLAMHFEPIARIRKRVFAAQNNPHVLIGEYFDLQWQTYRRSLLDSKLNVDRANILELGTGPILANGVRFIAEGAASYTALERFDVLRQDVEVRQAYRELIKRLPPEQQQRCRGLLCDAGAPRLFDSRIKCLVTKIEEAVAKVESAKWDFVFSFDVLEHVDDLFSALRSIRSLLKPGGVMIHRVDVGAHNVNSNVHRLAHLTVSDSVWRMVSSRRAICNRFRPQEFRAVADRLGFETLCFVPTTMLAREDIEKIRPRLWKRFADAPLDDLATLDFIWVARSPA
jgi:SAM-dependent methyltransferase